MKNTLDSLKKPRNESTGYTQIPPRSSPIQACRELAMIYIAIAIAKYGYDLYIAIAANSQIYKN